MQVYESLPAAGNPSALPTLAITIGVFDGVHQGHQELARQTVAAARRGGHAAALLTFQQHPLSLLAPAYCPKRLLAPVRKRQLLRAAGLDVVLDVEFTPEFAATSAEDFAQMLFDTLGVRHVTCGYDFRFGRAGAGDAGLLRQLGRRIGFDVAVVDAVLCGDTDVRSTAIREAVAEGHPVHAFRLMGRPYELIGKVVQGQARGRLIGFPTANLSFDDGYVLPLRGVYLTVVRIEADGGELRPAMTNVGFNPTFGLERLSIETHLLDYEGDLVGRQLELFFLRRLRDEKKFSGVEALRQQLENDRNRAGELLAEADVRSMIDAAPPELTP